MKCNVRKFERLLRFIIGTLLLTWAFAGGPFWAYGGLYLILTGAWGLCPIYSLFKSSPAGPYTDEQD